MLAHVPTHKANLDLSAWKILTYESNFDFLKARVMVGSDGDSALDGVHGGVARDPIPVGTMVVLEVDVDGGLPMVDDALDC